MLQQRHLIVLCLGIFITVIVLSSLKLNKHRQFQSSTSTPLATTFDDDPEQGEGEIIDLTMSTDSDLKKGLGLQARSRNSPKQTKNPLIPSSNSSIAIISANSLHNSIGRDMTMVRLRPDMRHLVDLPLVDAYKKLVNEYLAPWRGLQENKIPNVKVTQKMLAAMEYAYKGGSFRVRIINNKIYFRKLVHWKQTYRTQRMLWYLRLLYEILRKDKLLSDATLTKGLDFVIYVGDGAKVAADTFTTEAGFPLFSLRTSTLHVDIPIPDPVQHGSNGQYKWTETGKLVPWEERTSKLVFRGRGSCLKMQADNWHFCNRVRLQQLSKQFPNEIDAGIIQWNQIYKSGKMIVPPTTIEEIEKTTGLLAVEPLDFNAQSKYRYILDVDGGLGSSRKPGILSSGSVLFAGESPWYTYYEPLMEPYRHYLPVDRWLRGLPELVQWTRDNDSDAKRIMENGRAFEQKFLTVAASKQYMAILLDSYAELLDESIPKDGSTPVPFDYCMLMSNKEIADGPVGCSQEWILYNDHDIPDEIVADRKIK